VSAAVAMFAWLTRLFGSRRLAPRWVETDALLRRLRRGEMPLIIDVRGPEEFTGSLGHIEGSLNVPLAALPARTADLVRADCPIVTVCLTDERSLQAAAELTIAGARDVAVLRGGMRAWRAREAAAFDKAAAAAAAARRSSQ
jgi:rhodanese-related sulfurtransferase